MFPFQKAMQLCHPDCAAPAQKQAATLLINIFSWILKAKTDLLFIQLESGLLFHCHRLHALSTSGHFPPKRPHSA